MNPQALKQLERYAAENSVDLAEFRIALGKLESMRRYVDAETQFASDVLSRLEFGTTISEAVIQAWELAVGGI